MKKTILRILLVVIAIILVLTGFWLFVILKLTNTPRMMHTQEMFRYMIVQQDEGFVGQVLFFESKNDFRLEEGGVCRDGEMVTFDILRWATLIPDGVIKHSRGEYQNTPLHGRCYDVSNFPYLFQVTTYYIYE